MDQLDKIIALINLLRRLTGYAFERAHEIHVLTETAVETGKGAMVLALSQHHRAKIKDMQDKAGPIFRSSDLMTRKLEALFADPARMVRDLDDGRIDTRFERLMERTLDRLQAYQTLLGSHIFDLDEMAKELAEILQNEA
ncbi:MAG: hypothetical protein JOZ29_06590 [Deltaproteobacteria bacterium]|nr:hypothetical protein [Deltaproteobacteria bacterium]